MRKASPWLLGHYLALYPAGPIDDVYLRKSDDATVFGDEGGLEILERLDVAGGTHLVLDTGLVEDGHRPLPVDHGLGVAPSLLEVLDEMARFGIEDGMGMRDEHFTLLDRLRQDAISCSQHEPELPIG